MPPDSRAVGTGDPPNDVDALIRAANAAGGGFNVLNAAYAGGADPTGAADSTAAIQAALTAAATAAAANGGGVTVTGPPGAKYQVSNLLIDSLVTLDLQGALLQGKSGSTGYMIALKTAATTQMTTIRNMTLMPNTGTLGGIQLDNTGWSGTFADSLHVIDNVFVRNAGGDAFNFGGGIRSGRFTRLTQYAGQGYGFYLATGTTDCLFAQCLSGASANHGFSINDGNNMLTNCKAFYAGYNGSTWGTTQCGFQVTGFNTTLTGCSAQQNALHGINLQGIKFSTITGNECDTNSAGTSGGVGINTNGCQNCVIAANSGGNTAGLSPGAQAYGIQVQGTQTGTWFTGNAITGSSGDFHYVSGSGYSLLSGTSGLYLCPPTAYAPGTLTNLTVASTTLAAVSSANVNTGSFTAPVSGSVVVEAQAVEFNSAGANTAYALAAHGTVTPVVGNAAVFGSSTAGRPRPVKFLVTGLTPGTSYNFDLLFACASGTTTVAALGTTSTTPTGTVGGPVVMTVQAV